jgi:hypothetical protein
MFVALMRPLPVQPVIVAMRMAMRMAMFRARDKLLPDVCPMPSEHVQSLAE